MIEKFLNETEIEELHTAAIDLCFSAPENDRRTFQASNAPEKRTHLKDNYFLSSSNKIHYFYEADALDANGNLLVKTTEALNKVSAKCSFKK